MDIIDQMFPAAQADDTVIGQFFSGQSPQQILQAVHNESAHEMELWRELHSPAASNKITIEVKRR